MSEDVPSYGRASVLAYAYACPHCLAENTLNHADLQPIRDQLLGTDWECDCCQS